MPQAPLVAIILITLGGMLIAMQAPINAALGRAIESSVAAAALSFGVGFAVLMAVTLLSGEAQALPRAASVPKWLLLGGALGAIYVWSALWAVPILGVLTTMTLLILGQMIAAILLDHYGAFGLAAHDVSPWRVLAVVLVAAGAVLSRF